MEKPSTLPGRGGFDFNLDLIYDSSESDIRRPFFQWPNTFDRLRWYGLGVGWRFDLPHIHQNVLYLPNIGSFEFGHVEFMGMRFTNRSLQDMRLEGFGNFTSGNLRSTMRLRFHNGTVYYFYNHLILCMADRYGNTIRFEYEAAPLQPAGRRLTRIIDTN
ncbi:MAG: hypothetical protein FWF81_01580, partial [Defluviitaleaceae bacterium]|nr:hypothetical protein [Defluviitaleaceae bacterium]